MTPIFFRNCFSFIFRSPRPRPRPPPGRPTGIRRFGVNNALLSYLSLFIPCPSNMSSLNHMPPRVLGYDRVWLRPSFSGYARLVSTLLRHVCKDVTFSQCFLAVPSSFLSLLLLSLSLSLSSVSDFGFGLYLKKCKKSRW